MRHEDAAPRGQVARGVIPPGIKTPWPGKGSLVFSSMMSGRDHSQAVHELPKEAEREIEILFQHIEDFVKAAGGTLASIANVTLFLMDDAYREPLRRQWAKTFPDPAVQPAQHTLNVAPSGLRGERVQAIVTAHLAEPVG